VERGEEEKVLKKEKVLGEEKEVNEESVNKYFII